MKVKMLIAVAISGLTLTSVAFADETSSNLMTPQAPTTLDNSGTIDNNKKLNNSMNTDNNDLLSTNENDGMAATMDSATGDDY